jgi:hypothetical protein
MTQERKLNIGDEVLIFSAIYDNPNYKDVIKKPFQKGKVKDISLSDDLSYHGSPWYVNVYTVIGEDEKPYVGTYKNCDAGSVSYLTEEDYVSYLDNQIDYNIQKIRDLRELCKEIMDLRKTVDSNYPKQMVKTK